MLIPHRQLSPEALRGVIEEFVTREGTDYGGIHIPLEDKIKQVRRQLDKGEAVVVFDEETEQCNIVRAEEMRGRGE
jgi:uncharacterized protein YheU (UPF0270 family)